MATTAAHAAWVPYEPFSATYSVPGRSLELRIQAARRAFLLGPHGFWPSNLGLLLLQAGHREEARSVGVESGADALPLEISNSEARFGETLRLYRELVTHLPASREGSYRAFMAAPAAVSAALVLERPLPEAENLVARFIYPEPPLITTKIVPAEGALLVCLVAPEKTATRCNARMKQLFERGFFGAGIGGTSAVFDGAEPFVQHDYVGAAKAWRTLMRESSWNLDPIRGVLAIAFDRAGEEALAEKIDTSDNSGSSMNGADLSSVRSARRAEKRGDKARARELAQKVVDAWSVADETVPAVAEMRAILARVK